MARALVIGAGPAGLMAAEQLTVAGVGVSVAEAKPSVGRKLLMAGKSGLNLTKDEPLAALLPHYGAAASWLTPMLEEFGPDAVMGWARDLGQGVFTGSTGRVFPTVMKASPLLRAWTTRLSKRDVTFHTRWRWIGWKDGALWFETPDGLRTETPDATVLALGGASWARLGSDGAWTGFLTDRGVALKPFAPSNFGLAVNWTPHMQRHFGTPIKAIALMAGGATSRGEIIISSRGLEGGGLYPLSPHLRTQASLTMDLAPDLPEAEVAGRLSRRTRDSVANRLRKALRLDPAQVALMQEFGRPLPTDSAALARLAKSLPVRHAGPRPMDEAISTAGGIAPQALTEALMLHAMPGVFAAGEMLDWEAPTGGYLLTACLATGRWAGRAAADWARANGPRGSGGP